MGITSLERWLHRASMRLRALIRGGSLDRDLDEELGYHLDKLVEDYVARGLAPDAARRRALLDIGGVQQRKEECRDARRIRLIEEVRQDLGYALRTLRRAPAFATAAILTLALGIGATVAVFTVVNGVLLRPMPFPQPEQLFLAANSPHGPFIQEPSLADRDFLALRRSGGPFEHLAAFSTDKMNLTDAGDPAVLVVGNVTGDFFAALRVPTVLGRTLLPDDEQPGRQRVVVLSESLWRGRFGMDTAIVGKQVTLDGVRYSVVGVMPASFSLPIDAQAWTPKVIRVQSGNTFLYPVVGRLKSGVSVAQARAEFEAFVRQSSDRSANANDSWVGLLPLKELLVERIRGPLKLFAGAVAFVLLIACANVANLLLARASGRQREIAVRAALGASRARLIRQLFTESVLIALAGGVSGLLLARWAVPTLIALAPNGRIPRLDAIVIDGWVLAFTSIASLATALLFGLAPALRMTRRRFAGSLLPGGRTVAGGQDRLRAVLVVAEIALALILLTGAGLMLQSVLHLRAVDSGFRPDNVVALTLNLPQSRYRSTEALHGFHRDLLAELAALPEVEAAGAVNWRPLGEMLMRGDFQIEGLSQPDVIVDKTVVSAGYFRAMGIRQIRGRDFSNDDLASGVRVAVVSQSVARMISPSEDVIGRRVSLQTHPTPKDWLTVIGVVEDVKQLGPARASHPAIYRPYLQVDHPFILNHMTFAVRTTADPRRAVPAIRGALRAVDKDQPASSITLMTDVLGAATAEPAFQTRLIGVVATLALLLALVGTYGVLSCSVAQRTHEIGLRMALGARSQSVLWMVVQRTLVLGFAGIVVGTVGALLTTRLLTTFLFEITPTDPATFVAVGTTILIAAVAAGLVPARRATRVDPLVALRHE
jgi:predicted permease